ncbi:putative WEB family protein [Helianthus annuus]|nr:putative WEB family protein [Helianthus annuus]
MNQIKQTKRKIKTAEIRLIAARKLKEAARASEALARIEMKSISESQTLSEGDGVTLSFEEYNSLKSKAREAEESLVKKVNESVVKVNQSEILNRVEEATEEVIHSKRVLEEALSKAEAANNDKLKAEEALRKWRSDHGQRRKSTVQNSPKFKNSSSRNNARLLDVNGAHLGGNVTNPMLAGPILAPTMSIGQILSRKLLLTEEYYEKSDMKRKVSLAQMLSKPTINGGGGSGNGGGGGGGVDGCRGVKGKRKKFGFGRIQFLVTKPSKKKKKHSTIWYKVPWEGVLSVTNFERESKQWYKPELSSDKDSVCVFNMRWLNAPFARYLHTFSILRPSYRLMDNVLSLGQWPGWWKFPFTLT